MAILKGIDEGEDAIRGYEQDPLHGLAEAFLDVAKATYNESAVDIFGGTSFYRSKPAVAAMKKFFVENSYDPKDPRFNAETNSNAAKNIQEHIEHMGAIFDNDSKQAMKEAANPLGEFTPVVGMAYPVHKNVLMSAIFDQILPKAVAPKPKFTLSLETRIMIDTTGKRYDMFLEQNKIMDVVDSAVPNMDVIITLPEYRSIDILKDKFSLVGSKHNLSIKSVVTGLIANTWVKPGDYYYDATQQKIVQMASTGTAALLPVIFATGDIGFTPTYGTNDAIINKEFKIATTIDANGTVKELTGKLIGARGHVDNRFEFSIVGPDATAITALQFHAVVDVSSAAYKTPKFTWELRTDWFEIPEAPHITCQVTPEAVKDIQALYDVNHITKLMGMMNLGLLHWKDGHILQDLDRSFISMPNAQKTTAAVDWAPPVGQYMGDYITWRERTFMDQLDWSVSQLINVLNDENMTVLVVGRADIIKRVTPSTVAYTAPSNIGPIELDFTRTIVTSDKRVYNFVSTQKMRDNNNLIILLIPRNTMRITYQIVDYQMYVSNEIRDAEAFELPSMTCFERWMFLQYQPIQGRIQIMNVKGTRETIANPDPIGQNAMNNYTANGNTYASSVNGVAKTAGDFIGQAGTVGATVQPNRTVDTKPGYIDPKTM